MTTSEPRPAHTPGTDPTLGALGGPPGSGHPGTTPPAHGPSTAPAPAAPAPTTSGPTQRASRGTGRAIGRTLALALLVFVTVLLVLFVMYNTQTVDISLVFTDVQAPLVLALLIAAVLGGLVVALMGAARRARRRNR